MNVFTTKHPMTSQPSWFDTKAHPSLSFVCSVFALALVLTPLVLAGLLHYAVGDIGAEPDPFPDPWLVLFMGSSVAFALSLVCAFLVVLTGRLFALMRGRLRALAVVVVVYIATVGIVPAVFRHAQDGRLQWLRSVPAALSALEIYEWPARRLGRVPMVRELFELSANAWCGITGAPETTP